MSKILNIRLACIILSFVPAPSGATASDAPSARSWNGYTWARSGNLSIQLVNNTSAEWTPDLLIAASQWSGAANVDYRVVSGPIVDASICSPAYGVVEVCSADYGKNGWLGMTNVYTSGGHIVMATVRLNDYYPVTSAFYGSDAWYTNTICHELGHVLGLNHEDEVKNNPNSGSCLDLTSDPGGTKPGHEGLSDLAPGIMDITALADIYRVPFGVQLASTIDPNKIFDVPEPRVWGLLSIGFGLLGASIRRRSNRGTLVNSRRAGINSNSYASISNLGEEATSA